VPTPASSIGNITAPDEGGWGFGQTGQDLKTAPGNDFFRYVNGSWIDRTIIPDDKSLISLRQLMTDTIIMRLNLLFEEISSKQDDGSIAFKVGAFYKSFMDADRIESLGTKPLDSALSKIGDATTLEQISKLMGLSNVDFFSSFFSIEIDVDPKTLDQYTVFLGQPSLGLLDRDYYILAQFEDIRKQYKDYIISLLNLIGWPNSTECAILVLQLEISLAEASWSLAEARDVEKTYNPMSISDLVRLAPEFPWSAYLREAGLSVNGIFVIKENGAFPKIAKNFSTIPIETLKAWLAFTVADNAAPFLSKQFVDALFALRGKTLLGQHDQQPRWKRAIAAVSGGDYLTGGRFERFGHLGWAVGDLYSKKYFSQDSKKTVDVLVSELKAAFRQRLNNLNWMSPVTRTEALKKLSALTVKVGYPHDPRDYSSLKLTPTDLIENVRGAARFEWDYQTSRLGAPVDRDEWKMTPQTNNAYHGPFLDIVFPAGILQSPIFNPLADPAINFGALGSIIAHEMTHGFDDQGRKTDAKGRLRDWWTSQDSLIFEQLASKLGAIYESFEPLPGLHINGQLTMGENIADLGGVSIALEAYKNYLRENPASVIAGFTGIQRFFLGWAQAWRGKVRDEYLRDQLVSDQHSPRQYRVNGVVRNIDDWYDAFGVIQDQDLYLRPEDRVQIW
jgi:putative endopeptidase